MNFHSPYEAAAWALIGHRIRMTQAARLMAAMAEHLGAEVDIHGDRLKAFPAPSRFVHLDGFPGLFGRKVEYLRGLGVAALEGALDAGRLRSVDPAAALAQLRRLPGVGPFNAELILLRAPARPTI